MNHHDSEKISYLLENLGYEKENDIEKSDFIIYNTCLVRENAELKVYGQLGALKNLKRKKPEMIIAVCGCMMQTGDARATIISKYKHVDIIFGTKNISRLPSLISRHRSTGEVIVDIEEEDILDDDTPINREHPFIAYVNIMTGCNNYCTFCIVPYARGKEISRTPESIITEIKELANKGYKEITLLGQNVNSYGKTLRPKVSFPELLKMVNEVEGIERIRFLTSHPKDCSDELIEAIANLDKVCENIHLPFQSGSNRILKDMHRVYTREHYLDLIRKLKKKVPNITLSTDIIVGFPGETEEDFNDTLSLVENVEYDQGFTFLYSIRKGTKAAEMNEQIPHDIKQERFQRLIDTMYDIFYKKNKECVGKTYEVLVEGISKNNSEILTGRTRGYKLVHFKGGKRNIGQLVNVKITGHNSFALEGELV
ncbi:tRNA (N6-isopentenyl adenosine(37)-C2)-methylthiotransferase MiaB [Parvimonas micra]|jgi:tRNA-i(6)A37 thiotransferase enzyme miaB|nr:tRNA (N6-isopentenyl adenosine(37)-C2)-methylthiotransferase MiaB [Parvimonas micra]MCE3019773.1 tRNA (N6-isopentenyl adenosine(37)-C2)-methylthiotransferase MiaB [Parvimonas micra]